MRKGFFNIFILFCLCLHSYAQTERISAYQTGLRLEFTSSDERLFEKAEKLFQEAEKLENEARELYELFDELEKKEGVTKKYMKTLQTLIESSDLYFEAHTIIYQVYQEKIDAFYKGMRSNSRFAAGMNKAKYYEMRAKRNLAIAENVREQIRDADRFIWVDHKMKQVFEVEKNVLRDKGRALQIYQDFPVEYDYGWEDDVTPEEVAEVFGSKAVNEPPEDLFSRIKNKMDNDTTKNQKQEVGEIIFRVQIAAHTKPLSDEYINSLYQGNIPVDMIFEENWYKYQIGTYDEYEDALKTLEECNISRAFIVPYQDGKKLGLKEALHILGINQ